MVMGPDHDESKTPGKGYPGRRVASWNRCPPLQPHSVEDSSVWATPKRLRHDFLRNWCVNLMVVSIIFDGYDN